MDFSHFNEFFQARVPDVVLYPSIIVMIFAMVVGLCIPRVCKKIKYLLCCLLTEYVFIVICSTVLCRKAMPESRLEIMPFYDIIAAQQHVPSVSIWDVILNVVLFVPFGMLITAIKSSIIWWRIAFYSLILSFSIECSQLVLGRGLAQTDDLMNNTLGALLGFFFVKLLLKCYKYNDTKEKDTFC